MRRILLATALALLLCGASGKASAVPYSPCCTAGNCCCSDLLVAGGTPLFAYGCFTGNATDDRFIPLGFDAGGGWVLEKTTSEPGQCASYHTEAMGLDTDNSCSLDNCDPGTGKCAADRLQELRDQGFEIGTNHDVNRNAAPFCWYVWEKKNGYFDTLQYTGDGSSPRTVSLTFTPDVIMVINESGTVTTVLKTVDMPASTSCQWDSGNAEGACHANGVATIGTDSMTIGVKVNTNTVVYNVFYWKAHDGYVATGTYTGDGNSGGGGNALVADTQVISVPGCDVSYVMIAGLTASGLDFECDKQRGVNIGTGVSGPGYITIEPYAQAQSSLDEQSGIQDLTNGSFTVTGAPALEHSCNDLSVPYYWWATCGQPALPGTINAIDWSNQMLATWNMEALVDTDIANEAAGCQDCTLTNRSDLITVDVGESLIASDSLLFDISDDTAATCDMSTDCDELNNGTGDVSWSCWAKSTSDAQNQALLSHGDQSYASSREPLNNRLRCHVKGSTEVTAYAADDTWPINTWNLYVCTFDDSDDEIQAFVGGVASGSPAAQSETRLTTTANAFNIGENAQAGTANFEGNVNECFVYDGELSAAAICRIHACNLDGRACSCFSADPTIYVDEGRYSGSCSLPACNAVQP